MAISPYTGIQKSIKSRHRFDFALSFAGAEREEARRIAASLKSEGFRIFFDEDYEHEMIGVDGSKYLRDVYSHESRYCVVLISESYDEGNWTDLEREAIQSRELRRERDILIPVVKDGYTPSWLPSSRIYFDLSKRSERELTNVLVRKARSGASTFTMSSLRSTPSGSLLGEEIFDLIKGINVFHPNLNPQAKGVSPNLEVVEEPDYCIAVDHATGLTWDARARDAMTYQEAEEHIEFLNRDEWGEFSDWRLPTVEEAVSLIDPEKSLGRCYLPFWFSNTWKLWTSDRDGPGAHWVVIYSEVEFLTFEQDDDIAYVRAVRNG
jgi:Protein of unknown function (DUF1566)/TIR domain